MKKLLYILLFLVTATQAQVTIERQVIGTTGAYQTSGNTQLAYTAGEAVIEPLTNGNLFLAQGFHQVYISSTPQITYQVTNESCNGASNGSFYVNEVLGCAGLYNVDIRLAADTSISFSQTQLPAGDYIAFVTSSSSACFYNQPFTVELDSDESCTVKFYSGITPNGDGDNDVWHVDNIEQFPENNIKIYNRWGTKVWESDNYDNTTIVWSGENDAGEDLPDGTYFYVAIVDGANYQGWVEITR